MRSGSSTRSLINSHIPPSSPRPYLRLTTTLPPGETDLRFMIGMLAKSASRAGKREVRSSSTKRCWRRTHPFPSRRFLRCARRSGQRQSQSRQSVADRAERGGVEQPRLLDRRFRWQPDRGGATRRPHAEGAVQLPRPAHYTGLDLPQAEILRLGDSERQCPDPEEPGRLDAALSPGRGAGRSPKAQTGNRRRREGPGVAGDRLTAPVSQKCPRSGTKRSRAASKWPKRLPVKSFIQVTETGVGWVM